MPAAIPIVAAIIAAAAAENSSEQSRRSAHQTIDANKAAADKLQSEQQQNAQQPVNVQSTKESNAMAAAGADQTLLTGSMGIDNTKLNIGKNQLLGTNTQLGQ